MSEDTMNPVHPVPRSTTTDTRRHEVAVIGQRRYDLDLMATPDGRIEIEVIGDLDGEVIGELAGVIPPHDATVLCCLLGAAAAQLPGDQHVPVRRKAYEVNDIRRRHRNAYERWSPEDDARLLERYHQGASVPDLCTEFGRNAGGIRARLTKLGAEPEASNAST